MDKRSRLYDAMERNDEKAINASIKMYFGNLKNAASDILLAPNCSAEVIDFCMTKLILQKLDPNTYFGDGESLLHRAIRDQMPQTVRKLIDFNADTDARDALGRTPLMIACLHAPARFCMWVAVATYNFDAHDIFGKNVIDYAKTRKDKSILFIICSLRNRVQIPLCCSNKRFLCNNCWRYRRLGISRGA